MAKLFLPIYLLENLKKWQQPGRKGEFSQWNRRMLCPWLKKARNWHVNRIGSRVTMIIYRFLFVSLLTFRWRRWGSGEQLFFDTSNWPACVLYIGICHLMTETRLTTREMIEEKRYHLFFLQFAICTLEIIKITIKIKKMIKSSSK